MHPEFPRHQTEAPRTKPTVAAGQVGLTKPIVVTSKCLGFESCRYNGDMISAPFVQSLAAHVDLQAVCPEVEIGLGTPRDPIRLVVEDEDERLMQPTTGRDLTEKMEQFSQEYLGSLPVVDGFILKNRSPSCAVKDSKIHLSLGKEDVAGKGPGLFARKVLQRFPHVAIEDEGRLTNPGVRDHFLTKLFVQARYRVLRQAPSIQKLIHFQAQNKLLLMAYNQTKMRLMGRIVAGFDGENLSDLLDRYAEQLGAALARAPRFSSNINVLMHAFGYFSDRLTSREKAYFLDALESYREKRIPLASVITVLEAWITRFEDRYLESQTFFQPYPRELVELPKAGSEA